MATAANNITCNLVQAGTLEPKQANLKPVYTSLVVFPLNKVMVVDSSEKNLLIHSLHDGHRLAVSNRKESPCDICICSIRDDEIQVVVCFRHSSLLEILSIKSAGKNSTVAVVKKFNLRTEFHSCHGVKYRNEKLLICGKKKGNICWGIVSITDGSVDIVHNVCKCEELSLSYLSTTPHDDDTVYISCDAGDKYLDNSGVYGYRNSTLEFLYKHKDLNHPRGITVDIQGYIFVCNFNPPCIHHLTEKGQQMTIYREDIPSDLSAIFWEEQHGLLYITSEYSNMIRIYRPVYSDHQGLPREILNMDKNSIQLFEEALKDGKENVYRIRVMVVGYLGVGKTTFIKRLLGEEVDITRRCSTEGIDVHLNCCNVSLATHTWTKENKGTEQGYLLQRLVKVVSEKHSATETLTDKESIMTPHEGESTPDTNAKIHDVDLDKRTQDCHFPQQDTEQNRLSTVSQQDESDSTVDQRNLTQSDTENTARSELAIESHKKDQTRETIKLLREKSDSLKPDGGKYALLTMYDFAGQYAFYTTHQMFLSRRAIYLLVSDVSGNVSDLVEDSCYLDSKGRRKCRVHELVEVWMNSIHSCAPTEKEEMNSSYSLRPSDTVTPPPVILVGTHVDLIPQRPFDQDTEESKQSQKSQTGMLPSVMAPQPTVSVEQPVASTSQESTQISSHRQQ